MDYLSGWNMTSSPGQVRSGSVRLRQIINWSGQVRTGLVGLPNWSQTGLNLTSPLRSDLVRIDQVMSDYLTAGQYMTSPLRWR